MSQRFAWLGSMGVTLILLGAGCANPAAPPANSPSPTTAATESASDANTPAGSPAPTSSAAPQPTVKAPAPKPAAIQPVTTLSATEKYQQALNTYRSAGAYFQFVGCHANPGTLSIKRGVSYMIDNRDKAAHTIKVGNVSSYRVGGYGYAIVKAPAPGRYYITCDDGGSGLLNVEG